MKIYSVGPDELGPFSDRDFPPGKVEWFVYHYTSGSWDGSGTGVIKRADGTYGWANLSHCSCYGPLDGGYSNFGDTNPAGLVSDLATKPGDYDFAERSSILAKLREIEPEVFHA